MNRFAFLGSQTDEAGQEWCYVLDTQTGTTLKSPVKAFGGGVGETVVRAAVAKTTMFGDAPAVKEAPVVPAKLADASGDMETPEQRQARLGKNKVPPAFLGDIRRMHLDPAKTDGKTDVTQSH